MKLMLLLFLFSRSSWAIDTVACGIIVTEKTDGTYSCSNASYIDLTSGFIKDGRAGSSTDYGYGPTGVIGGNSYITQSVKHTLEMKIAAPGINTGTTSPGSLCYVWKSRAWEKPCDYLNQRFTGRIYKCSFNFSTLIDLSGTVNYLWSDISPNGQSIPGFSTPPDNPTGTKTYRMVDCRNEK